jgi:hypothetical protein
MLDVAAGLGVAKELADELAKVVAALRGARRESRIRVAEYCERLAASLTRMSDAFKQGEIPYEAGHEFKDSITQLRSVLAQTFPEDTSRGEQVIGRLSARLTTLLQRAEEIDWGFVNRPGERPAAFNEWSADMLRAAGDLRGLANRLRAT